MHFYDFNIGDYAKKTAHLTNGEDLAYRRALDVYYDTEKPFDISGGLATLSRRLRVDEKDLKNVIEEFFPDGRNKHADEKIAAYYAYVEKQKANGKLGGRPKHNEIKPTANPVVSQNNPTPSQPLTTKPLTTNQKETTSATFVLPEFINSDDWNLWIKTRKGKKLNDQQKQGYVDKLWKWMQDGIDYQSALKDAALAGWQGLHEPKAKFVSRSDRDKEIADQLTGRSNATTFLD